ncbi:hypothetical protein, partial [Acinetobacter baumannii]|uniref:hypothetical protein n=1 Tax=Acinetobacter baumannii TaxID=470 RepID=UPI001CDCB65D
LGAFWGKYFNRSNHVCFSILFMPRPSQKIKIFIIFNFWLRTSSETARRVKKIDNLLILAQDKLPHNFSLKLKIVELI